jgi:hypothetical protein
VGISDKGAQAFRDGTPSTANPYAAGYRNQNGPGGNIQAARRQAWLEGWNLEAAKAKEVSRGSL